MFELKPLSDTGIPRATAKAERYRLLGEPQEAESICRDILRADRENQEVLSMLLLAITDQFARGGEALVAEAHQVRNMLRGEYERAYYSGIISERWLKAQLKGGGRPEILGGWFIEALDWYRKAQALSPPGNEDAVLRWNACVRFLERHPGLLAETKAGEPDFSDA